jgi:hypothetical protein
MAVILEKCHFTKFYKILKLVPVCCVPIHSRSSINMDSLGMVLLPTCIHVSTYVDVLWDRMNSGIHRILIHRGIRFGNFFLSKHTSSQSSEGDEKGIKTFCTFSLHDMFQP